MSLEYVEISGNTEQLIFKQLARFSMNKYGMDLFYLFQAFKLLREEMFIKEPQLRPLYSTFLEQFYGKKCHEQLVFIEANLQPNKMFFDDIKNKSEIDDFDINNPKIVKLIDQAMKISVLNPIIYSAWTFLLNRSSLKNKKIPVEMIKEEKRAFTKIDLLDKGREYAEQHRN